MTQPELYHLYTEHDTVLADTSILTPTSKLLEKYFFNAQKPSDIGYPALIKTNQYAGIMMKMLQEKTRVIPEVVEELENFLAVMENKRQYLVRKESHLMNEDESKIYTCLEQAIESYDALIGFAFVNRRKEPNQDMFRELIQKVTSIHRTHGSTYRPSSELYTDEKLVAAAISNARENKSTLLLSRDKNITDILLAYDTYEPASLPVSLTAAWIGEYTLKNTISITPKHQHVA